MVLREISFDQVTAYYVSTFGNGPAPFLLLFSIVNSVFHQYGGPTWKYFFPCSADNAQDWQPYPVDLYSAICDDHTYIKLNARKRVGTCRL